MIWPHEFALYTCYIASMMSKDIKKPFYNPTSQILYQTSGGA